MIHDTSKVDLIDRFNEKIFTNFLVTLSHMGDIVACCIIATIFFIWVNSIWHRGLIDVELSIVTPEESLINAFSFGVPVYHSFRLFLNYNHILVFDEADLEVIR